MRHQLNSQAQNQDRLGVDAGVDATDEASAVALRYDPVREEAPRVVAKGRGEVAEQILEIARANGIAIREDPDLVALLESVELDIQIPLEAFVVVAEILAYVYRANARLQPADAAGDEGPGR